MKTVYITIIIAFIGIYSLKVNAQQPRSIKASVFKPEDRNVTFNLDKYANEDNILTHTDSLFKEKRFDDLIEYCHWQIDYSQNSWYARQILMGALYAKGDAAAAYELFDELLNAEGLPNTPYSMLQSNSLVIASFVEIETHKERLYNKIIERYKEAQHPNMDIGLEIKKHFLDDQWIRRSTFYKTENRFDSGNQKQLDAVYAFYEKHNKMFSEKEVGSSVAFEQYALLCHETDLTRRAFYLSLIQAAVKSGNCHKYREMNFIIRTEEFKDRAAFFDRYAEIVDDVKNKYGETDFFYTIF